MNHDEQFTHNGAAFRVHIVRDEDLKAPWEEHDGHGVVSEWTTRRKAPGERVLIEDRGSRRYYDVVASTLRARRDGWDAPPYAPGETAGQRAARAVEADFQRLRAWCNDEWYWISVIVDRLNAEGFTVDRESLSGIESDAGPYIDEVARELAGELLNRPVPAVSGPPDRARQFLERVAGLTYSAVRENPADIVDEARTHLAAIQREDR